MNIISRFFFTVCIWTITTAHVQAHDFWLHPDPFTPVETQSVDISLHFGVDLKGETLPYITSLFTDFSVSDKDGRTDIQSTQGNDPAAKITASAGAQLIGYQSEPQFVELDAAKFEQYTAEEGIEYIRTVRERRGESNSSAPENFIRCAKALVHSGPDDHDLYRRELGYTLELIPQSDPYLLKEGDTLEFELLYKGDSIDGLLLQAIPASNPNNKQRVRTDKDGKASVVMNETGMWLIKAVLILPVERRQALENGAKAALWQSYWASYTFALDQS